MLGAPGPDSRTWDASGLVEKQDLLRMLAEENYMTIPFEEIKARLLADHEVQREYDALAPEFEALAESLTARQALGKKQPSSRRVLKTDPNFAPERRGDIDERIKRESCNPPAQQVVDAWLSDAAALCRFLLRPALLLDDCLDLVHQIRAHSQVRRLFRRVGNRIPDIGEFPHFQFAHNPPRIKSLNRSLAISLSRLEVTRVFF